MYSVQNMNSVLVKNLIVIIVIGLKVKACGQPKHAQAQHSSRTDQPIEVQLKDTQNIGGTVAWARREVKKTLACAQVAARSPAVWSGPWD